jgi:phosphoribosyl-ATP pyrophosphohydrolase
VALRASSEMHELVEAALFGDEADMIEEAADIIIVLMRVFHNRGVDYRDVIDRKMRKNRSRQWKLDGTGSGQHVG